MNTLTHKQQTLADKTGGSLSLSFIPTSPSLIPVWSETTSLLASQQGPFSFGESLTWDIWESLCLPDHCLWTGLVSDNDTPETRQVENGNRRSVVRLTRQPGHRTDHAICRLSEKHSGLYDDCMAYFSPETHISAIVSGWLYRAARAECLLCIQMSLHMELRDVYTVFLAFFRKNGDVKGEKIKMG